MGKALALFVTPKSHIVGQSPAGLNTVHNWLWPPKKKKKTRERIPPSTQALKGDRCQRTGFHSESITLLWFLFDERGKGWKTLQNTLLTGFTRSAVEE